MQPVPGRGAAVLAAVHRAPGSTRAEVARRLGLSTGALTEVVTRLRDARLVDEAPAAPTGRRGRPTTALVAHPDGPVVAVADIGHDGCLVAAVELGGRVLSTARLPAPGAVAPTLDGVATQLRRLRRRYGARVVGAGVSVPGVVRGSVLLQAPNLGWADVDLRALWPRPGGAVLRFGNDATFAGVAEAVRGAAVGAGVLLHLHVVAGVGGTIVDHGVAQPGAHGQFGEFGHLPLGDPGYRCACGATGCWDGSVDGRTLARLLGRRTPRDPAGYAQRVIARAARDPAAAAAVRTVAASIGRGSAGLVNALDPDAVTLGGTAGQLLHAAPDAVHDAYRAGLMSFRRRAAPPLLAATLGERGALLGAAEDVVAAWLA